MRQKIRQDPFLWASCIALTFIAVFLIAPLFGQVDDWHDNWREYAAETRLTGVCAVDPDASVCEENPFEPWKFVPWGFLIGTAGAIITIVMPVVWHRS